MNVYIMKSQTLLQGSFLSQTKFVYVFLTVHKKKKKKGD